MWLEIGAWQALGVSALLSFLFVLSLYLWRHATLHDRDDPTVIKQRLFSVVSVCIIAPVVMLQFARVDTPEKHGPPFTTWIGFPTRGLDYAATVPLLLTASLFLGPMYLHLLHYPSPTLQLQHLSALLHSLYSSERHRLMTLRNLVFAPLAEEFIFRTCTCSLLAAAGYSITATLLLSPLLFALSHLHHLIGLVRTKGFTLRQAVLAVTFQLFHTALFGAFAAHVYLSTGSFVACALSHAFCNMMEFPDLGWLFNSYHAAYGRRLSVGLAFVLGMALFALAMRPAMELEGYHNWLPEVRRMAQEAAMNAGGGGREGVLAAGMPSVAEGKEAMEGLGELVGMASSDLLLLSSTATRTP